MALYQANRVKEGLEAIHEHAVVEIKVLSTRGDQDRTVPLWQVGGIGLFVRELERALETGEIDFAVHSMKDLPSRLDEGFCMAAIPERAEPWDALIAKGGLTLDELPPGAVVGTSSLRRRAQIFYRRPDLRPATLRGNVDTRIGRVENGEVDAAIMALAGLQRMGLDRHVTQVLPAEVCLPAVGQGALAVECRADDQEVRECLAALDEPELRLTIDAERAFLAELGGGCHVPAAAFAELDGGRVRMRAMIAMPDGTNMIRESGDAVASEGVALGRRVAEAVLARGGWEIVASLG